ncbi:hypothetical protein EI94DRAFT_1800723 [Lactarius quietus]|nr:hypothetical protein EI94DRAFT_1800723 [Lactarius quietus]
MHFSWVQKVKLTGEFPLSDGIVPFSYGIVPFSYGIIDLLGIGAEEFLLDDLNVEALVALEGVEPLTPSTALFEVEIKGGDGLHVRLWPGSDLLMKWSMMFLASSISSQLKSSSKGAHGDRVSELGEGKGVIADGFADVSVASWHPFVVK